MQSNFVETLIGAVVLAIAGVFLYYAYSVSDLRAAGGYFVTAEFDRVDGLTTGSDVRMSGIKVGTVVSQTINPKTYYAIVTISLRDDLQIPSDSSAKITSEGLLGSNYVALVPGGAEEYLANGDEIQFTQGPVDLIGLVGQAVFSAQGTKGSSE